MTTYKTEDLFQDIPDDPDNVLFTFPPELAKEMDIKAAKAEEKAAKENKDEGRLSKATAVLKTAEEDLKVIKLLVKWKNKEVKARRAGVKKAKLALQVSEAKRDVARVSRLLSERVPSAQKYAIAEYQKRLRDKQEDFANATNAERRDILEAEKSKAEYERIPRR